MDRPYNHSWALTLFYVVLILTADAEKMQLKFGCFDIELAASDNPIECLEKAIHIVQMQRLGYGKNCVRNLRLS